MRFLSFAILKAVIENAKIYKQKTSIELCRVLIHGVLHLIGLDDQTSIEKENMTNLENKYLNNTPEILK